jgi:hypothetical protein
MIIDQTITYVNRPAPRPPKKGFGFGVIPWVIAWTVGCSLMTPWGFLDHALLGLFISGVYWLILRPIAVSYWRWCKSLFKRD